MSLAAELERAAAAAAAYGRVRAVLAAEPSSNLRTYLVALGDDGALLWLVLDAAFEPLRERERVRETASIVVLCELASELAEGAGFEELLDGLATGATAPEPHALAAARAAAAELARVVGVPPRIASAAYLDLVGAAVRSLERELGEHGSPLARALGTHGGTVEAFIAEVEGRHGVALR